MTDTMREDTAAMNQMIENGMLKAVQDPTRNFYTAETENRRAVFEFRAASKCCR